ncbi:hypothetical protein GWK47_001174 [Chionoecetes opilio]|uniref:Uncharacterized protein n=1 Tax=Chionoecetes opilio TaxID=41210 RepID=A0A8J5CMV1_CHIOP|nr:hypothetical protein GWK47_001174 [Chionoecetes opilio]
MAGRNGQEINVAVVQVETETRGHVGDWGSKLLYKARTGTLEVNGRNRELENQNSNDLKLEKCQWSLAVLTQRSKVNLKKHYEKMHSAMLQCVRTAFDGASKRGCPKAREDELPAKRVAASSAWRSPSAGRT